MPEVQVKIFFCSKSSKEGEGNLNCWLQDNKPRVLNQQVTMAGEGKIAIVITYEVIEKK